MHGTRCRHDKLQYVQVGRALTKLYWKHRLFRLFPSAKHTNTHMHSFSFGLPILFKICIFLSALAVNFMREFASCRHVTLTRTVSVPALPPSSNALQMLWPEICHLQIHNEFTSREICWGVSACVEFEYVSVIEWQTYGLDMRYEMPALGV